MRASKKLNTDGDQFKKQLYEQLYNCKLSDIDRNLTKFIKGKKMLSHKKNNPPSHFEY